MSNRVSLVSTEFSDYTGKSYGFRIYDDLSSSYVNTHEYLIGDNIELLRVALDTDDDVITELISYALSRGIFINGGWYEPEEIRKHLNLEDDS